MQSTVVRPADPELRAALRLAAYFALALFLFHLAANLWQTHIGYGYFRDEFYYILCGRRLAWGYVDHGPLVAIQARLAETLFGRSLAGLRSLSALGGAARVFLSGLLAWSLGGRRPAQTLAMVGVAFAPIYLGVDSILSMNSSESVFWMTSLLAVILMANGRTQKLWLLFGLSAGLGLLNKPSMTFFLLALLAALIISPQRTLLRSKWAVYGVAVMFLLVLPNILWQFHNHWPTWEFLHNGRVEHKNKELAPPIFLLTQILNLNPAAAFIWIPGLIYLLRRRPHRYLGLTYVFFLIGMMALHAKDYYVVPIYPILFAAGGLAWQQRFRLRRRVQQNRAFAFPAAILTMAAVSLAVLPMHTPFLRPETFIAYAHATGLYKTSTNSENRSSGPLPQFYADRFGWQEEVDIISRAVNQLSPQDRADALIKVSNYGHAGAIDFLGVNLPPAVSGHNNYFLWGMGPKPSPHPGRVIILIERTTPEHLHLFFKDVTLLGHTGTTYSMPGEDRPIYLLQNPVVDPTNLWQEEKHYD